MVELFGIDIAQEVANALEEAGNLVEGTLFRESDGSEHKFQGFIEFREIRQPGSFVVVETVAVLTIIGASLPEGVTPNANDRASIGRFENGQLSDQLSVDPTEAVYEFRFLS